MVIKDPVALFDLCLKAVNNPDWQPVEGRTFCNYAADFVALGMGCNDLCDEKGVPLLADGMVDVMKHSGDWREVTLPQPSVYAAQGSLVFGAATSTELNETHGHLSVVIPGESVYSGHWDKQAPLCANVGKENFIGRPMSYAFRNVPTFYAWRPSL